jgi:phage tail protein X
VADVVYEDYRCQSGDTVDLIAYQRFGSSSGTTESILDANPGLSAIGPILPLGMMLRIPIPVKADRVEGINLWS